ncbi:MAG TPA: LytR C-terminal domain-containing protein [Actinomycetota bacterium]|nr:LytR C-terminal domain-containing protein [Actinomycetota bacterium]
MLLAVLATAATSALLIAREHGRTEPEVTPPAASGLALLVVRTDGGSLPVVVGSTGFGTSGALVVSPAAQLVIPGQGESSVREALDLRPRQAATAVGSLLGVWIDDGATIEADRLAAMADEVGGVRIGGDLVGGRGVAEMLEASADGDVVGLQVVMEALLSADVAWSPTDLADADDPGAMARILEDASGAQVVTLDADEVASGVLRATPRQVSDALVEAFGGPAEEAVPVIVLNGNGVPGIGEAVAERLLPGGFRVAVSQNASDFDHPETLIVVGSPDDVGLAERVRDLLGVGSVSVSVGSGIAPVTVVIGKDFTG